LPIPKIHKSFAERPDAPEARLRQLLTRLKERDFRLTPQRLAILKILATSDGHPSVDKIFDQVKQDFPTTSLATVYKTVTLLKELGEVLELGFPDGSNRYDGSKPYPHPHMVCLKCKRISDPDLQSVEELTREAEQKTGFDILSHRLDFFGLCPDCRQAD
jgi:Fur family peroxide stress response transcriptional regulator